MATQYFRITGYSKEHDLSFIVDSNGYFEKLWQFSVFVRDKGMDVIEVSNDERFLDVNINKIAPNDKKIIIRATQKGKPEQIDYTLDGITYKAIKVKDKIYIPEKD